MVAFLVVLTFQSLAKDFDDKQYKLKISIPDTWKSNISMDGADKVYDFLSQDEMAFIQLRSFKADAGLSLDLLVKVYEENYLPNGSQRQGLSNKPSSNGIPGKSGIYLVKGKEIDVRITVFYAIQRGQGYTLSAIVPIPMMSYYQNDVNSILQSFVIPGYEKQAQPENKLAELRQMKNNAVQPYNGPNIVSVKMGDKLISDTEIENTKTVFPPQTEVIYAVFDWIGEGASGKKMKMAWIYDQDNYKIDETNYTFPDFESSGGYNTSLIMPYHGWPEGDYHIEFSIAGQIVYEAKFTISEDAVENTQNDFYYENDAGDRKQANESNLFEGHQVKREMIATDRKKEIRSSKSDWDEKKQYSNDEYDRYSKNSSKNSGFEKIMQEAANKLNKTCPILVDSETQLDNVEIVNGDTFKYNYTLLHSIRSEMDMEGTVKYLEPLLVKQVKSNSAMAIYRENKITMAYYYYDKNGDLAFKIIVSPDKYKK